MEILGGIALAVVLLSLVGIVTVAAIPLMLLLGLLTEMSFKRVFFASFAMALLAPILVGVAIGEAVQDGSIERDLRGVFSERIQLPDDMGDRWREALPKLQEISREADSGAISEDEAERRVQEVFSDFEDLQITIDVDGDGVFVGDRDSGVPLQLPEMAEIIENRDVREDVVVIEGNSEAAPEPTPDDPSE